MTQEAAPRRAKIELLIRREDDGGFELREVESSLAFVHLRPQRVAADSYELAEVRSRIGGPPSFVLKNRRTDQFLLLSEPERFLWDSINGATSLEEMATAYVLRYGAFDFDIIPNLIRKLQRAQLLTLVPASRLRQALARNRERSLAHLLERMFVALERLTVRSRAVHASFERLYRWGGWLLFTRPAIVVIGLLAIPGVIAGARLWPNADDVAAGLGAHPVLAILGVKLLFFSTIAAHQAVHGLALVHYGRRVREFGFTLLHGFVPTFYVDVTDIFMATRKARVVTAISGPLVHLVLGAIGFMVAARLPAGFSQGFAAASALVQWQAFVIALYPVCFIEMDGYHVLVDMLGVPTLKHDAVAYVRGLLRGSRRRPATREERLWIGYVVLSAVSVGVFVAFNIVLIVHAIS